MSSNTTTGAGGAFDNNGNGAAELINSTVSGNTANIAGAGILNRDDGTLVLSSSTVTTNTARNGSVIYAGSGIYAYGLSEKFSNTIIAGNASPSFSQTVEVNGDYTEGEPNLIGGNPKLGALADNGGPTKTHALLTGSPAIDAGETDLTQDQRGFARPADGDGNGSSADDIGAFEKDARQPDSGALHFEAENFVPAREENATIQVVRTGGAEGAVEVDYATSDGTATAGSDYTAASGTLTFADGETRKSFGITVADDTLDEPDETVNLKLSYPQGGAALDTPSKAKLTITDDDEPLTISVADAAPVVEGDSGTTNTGFDVALSAASGNTVTVGYATADGTARQPDDYTSTSGTLTFEPGETEKTVTVPVNGDTSDEPDETFAIELAELANTSFSDGIGGATITDDDIAGITVSLASGLATTEAGATATFTVVLDSKPASDVTIPLSSSDTSEGAVSPLSLTFTPESYDTPQTVTVAGVDDADDGDVSYEAVTGESESSDLGYDGRDAANVSVTNADDEAPPAPNASPDAKADSYVIRAKSRMLTVPVSSGVLKNESDPDSDRLAAKLVSGPSKGTLALKPDGSFTYKKPKKGFRGVKFVYEVSDGKGGADRATMTIKPKK